MENVKHGESRTLPTACPACKASGRGGTRIYADPLGKADPKELRWRCTDATCEKSRQWNLIEEGA